MSEEYTMLRQHTRNMLAEAGRAQDPAVDDIVLINALREVLHMGLIDPEMAGHESISEKTYFFRLQLQTIILIAGSEADAVDLVTKGLSSRELVRRVAFLLSSRQQIH